MFDTENGFWSHADTQKHISHLAPLISLDRLLVYEILDKVTLRWQEMKFSADTKVKNS